MAEHNLQLALYFLEMLYSKGPLPLNLVAEIYQNKILPQQMISYEYLINETVLFLKQYPSLFQTDTEFVFPASNDNSCHSEPLPSNNVQSGRFVNNRRLSIDDNELALESEAVKYFQTHLMKKEDRWIPIKSLAGHLSQASDNVRLVIGNQSLFTAFLMRHSHVFELQGELVGLKDNLISNKSFSSSTNGRRKSKGNPNNDSRSVKSDDTNTSDSAKSNQSAGNKKRFVKETNKSSQLVTNFLLANASKLLKGEPNGQNSVTIALTASDYKTITYLHHTIKSIEEGASECNLGNLMMNIIRNSSNNITSIVGFTQVSDFVVVFRHCLAVGLAAIHTVLLSRGLSFSLSLSLLSFVLSPPLSLSRIVRNQGSHELLGSTHVAMSTVSS